MEGGNINYKERKDNLLDEASNTLAALKSAVDAIREGESESSALSRLGIKKSFFRRLVFSPGKTVFENRNDKSEYEEEDEELLFSGWEKLYSALTGNKSVPYDAEETAKWCLEHTNLSNREESVVLLLFLDGLTLKEVYEIVNGESGACEKDSAKSENIRRIEASAIRKIRRANTEVLSVGSCHRAALENAKLSKYLERLQKLHEENERIREAIASIEAKEKAVAGCVQPDMRTMTVTEFVRRKVKEEGVFMSVRTFNCIQRGSILSPGGSAVVQNLNSTSMHELQGMPVRKIARLRNLGKRGLAELVEFFASQGVYFTDKNGSKYLGENAGASKPASAEDDDLVQNDLEDERSV